MSTCKQDKAVQNLLQQIWQLSKTSPKQQMQWLLRGLLIIGRQQRLSKAGFLLLTVATVSLVIVLLSTAMMIRTFAQSRHASNVGVNQAVLNAATPALDCARAKIDALFADLTLPRATPSPLALYNAFTYKTSTTPLIDRYTLNSMHFLSVAPDTSSPTRPVIWAVPGLKRIGQQEQPGEKTSIKLYTARGEYEPFQIGIRAPKSNLTNVNVSVSNLYGPNNQTISKTNITLYREHYVHVSHSSPNWGGSTNSPLGPGWYADGLIPFVDPETKEDLTGAQLDAVPFNLKTNRNQPIWLDVFVPRNTQPGQYTGTFTVTSDQGQASGKILLKVWDFELPLKPSLNSEFGFWKNMPKSANVELLKHKLMPKNVELKDERELIDNYGLTSANLGFWSGGDHGNYEMDPAPSIEEFQEATTWHQPDLFLYNYTADEIGGHPALYKPIKQWARNMHRAGVDNLVTMAPVPELYDDGSGSGRSAVDIWVVMPTMYDEAPDRVSEVLRKGDKVWFYNALVQDGYSPKWQIDFEPINFRIPHGFINQSLGLTGALYWRADLWTNDPWNNVQTYFSNNHHYPGEGMLVYPGEQVGIQGIVPSMRLKWLREGVEDYEYIELLKGLGRKEWALTVSRGAGLDWKHWTRDPNVLESARRKLGEEIEKRS